MEGANFFKGVMWALLLSAPFWVVVILIALKIF